MRSSVLRHIIGASVCAMACASPSAPEAVTYGGTALVRLDNGTERFEAAVPIKFRFTSHGPDLIGRYEVPGGGTGKAAGWLDGGGTIRLNSAGDPLVGQDLPTLQTGRAVWCIFGSTRDIAYAGILTGTTMTLSAGFQAPCSDVNPVPNRLAEISLELTLDRRGVN